MKTLLGQINLIIENPFYSIAMFILAMLGITLAIIFYQKGNRVKEPIYSVRSFNLIKDFLIEAAFAGLTPPASFKFIAVNMTDMTDKQDINHSGSIALEPPRIE